MSLGSQLSSPHYMRVDLSLQGGCVVVVFSRTASRDAVLRGACFDAGAGAVVESRRALQREVDKWALDTAGAGGPGVESPATAPSAPVATPAARSLAGLQQPEAAATGASDVGAGLPAAVDPAAAYPPMVRRRARDAELSRQAGANFRPALEVNP